MVWKNKETKQAYQKAYYEKNKKEILAKNKIWAKANRQKGRARSRKWYVKNKDKVSAKSRRLYWERGGKERQWEKLLKEKYGITPFGYDLLLKLQNGVCGICGQLPKKRQLDVDHEHSTGKVRGLLCSRCNKGLQMFYDDPKLFIKASYYLKERVKCISRVLLQKEVDRTYVTKLPKVSQLLELQLF